MEENNIVRSDFQFYSSEDGTIQIRVIVEGETVWLTQKQQSELFDVDQSTISEHLKNIFEEREVDEFSSTKEILVERKEGKRMVKRNILIYNLDAILSVGYRVKSATATRFRQWATQTLREYIIKGFALDDERLKQGKQVFGKDYFAELLERIREIRASERMFYQKITDLYATSIDYHENAFITRRFYQTVQNKLHWAIHSHTAAELIHKRADATKPNMGLTNWKNAKKKGKILKSDVSIGKNYLSEEEIRELNRTVSAYLDIAEGLAIRRKKMTMADWVEKLDDFLKLNEYNVLGHTGKISAKLAKEKAEAEYKKFRVIQDREYISDFDEFVEETRRISGGDTDQGKKD